MVKVIKDYITEITKEELSELGENDELYIENDDENYYIQQEAIINADDKGISFIYLRELKHFNYKDIKIYRVKKYYGFLNPSNEENNFAFLSIGVCIGIILTLIIGGL